jgi:hypothetical protein
MATQLLGASPSHLLGLGDQMSNTANQLAGLCDNTERLVVALAWRGGVADAFVSDWYGTLQVRLRGVADDLHQTGANLAVQAQEQEVASAHSRAATEGFLPDVAQRYGHPRTLINSQILVAGEVLNDSVLATLKSVARSLGGLDAVALFTADIAEHPELSDPVEAGLHGLVEVGLTVAAEHGISQASIWLGTALGGLLVGVGALAGRAVGWLAGELATVVFQKLDQRFELIDTGADLAVATFRYFRDNPRELVAHIPGIGLAITQGLALWETASELVGQS